MRLNLLNNRSNLSSSFFLISTPLPNTVLHKKLDAEGRIIDRNWDNYDCTHVVFKPKQMKPEELRSLSKEELLAKEKALKEELYKLNLQRYSGRVEKPHMFSLVKRDIARIRTILGEKK